MNAIQKISLHKVAKSTPEKYVLSINLRIDGLSFLIQNEQKENIHLEHFEWLNVNDWNKTQENVSSLLMQHELLKLNFPIVHVFIQSTDSFIIPTPLYSDTDQKLIYEKYLGHKDHAIFSNKFNEQNLDAYLIFGVKKQIAENINQKWKKVSWSHYSLSYIDSCIQKGNHEQELFIKLQSNYFEVVSMNNKVLESHNYFRFSSAEEYIFNLLSYIRQIGFDIEKLHLHIEGKIIESSTLYQLGLKYIPHISFEAKEDKQPIELFHDLIQAVNYADR
ncbi:MAG: hypothetical protein DRI84_08920 [Bacteroidetes bacterium]|nr:MAG: hypothetical protein DRI84_08920 [Bacteroidota bacterium]